jgi:hypothetical protein
MSAPQETPLETDRGFRTTATGEIEIQFQQEHY